jgi:hypothetical protein
MSDSDAGEADAGTPDSGGAAEDEGSSGAGGATQPGDGEPCAIVDSRIVLPEGGFCTVSEEQQVMFGLIGDFDEASCSEGRVSLGGLSAGRLNLNGVEISCEPS